MVAHLARLLGPANLDLAEEAAQEAMLRALQTWPHQGIPENAPAWLFRTAHNVAIDVVRRKRILGQKTEAIVAELSQAAGSAPAGSQACEQLRDDELRMIFMCCHPAIPSESQVALGLKIVSGFSVREIARAFLAEETAIAQRLVRAKKQIREKGLTLELPREAELSPRLDSVLEVLYFLFNEGYAAHGGDNLVRQDLCFEALRLGRLVADSPVGTPRAHALVSLFAFQAARLPARVDPAGELVLLEEQDHSLWDSRLIALGFRHFERAMVGGVTALHAEAAIAATHARAANAAEIDWPTILRLYDQLLSLHDSPIIALNRAVAVARVDGPLAALQAIEPLTSDPKLKQYYLLLPVRGQLLFELGCYAEAAACFRAAQALPCSEPERRLLRRKESRCMASATL